MEYVNFLKKHLTGKFLQKKCLFLISSIFFYIPFLNLNLHSILLVIPFIAIIFLISFLPVVNVKHKITHQILLYIITFSWLLFSILKFINHFNYLLYSSKVKQVADYLGISKNILLLCLGILGIIISLLGFYFIYQIFSLLISYVYHFFHSRHSSKNNLQNKIVFFVAFSVYFTLGLILINYSHENYNFFFGADVGRIYLQMFDFQANFLRISVHPLFVIIFQPALRILADLFNSSDFTIVLVETFFAALSVDFVFRILKILLNSRLLIFILVIGFGFSFSNIIFSNIAELYVFSGAILSGFSFWIVKNTYHKTFAFTNTNKCILVLWGILCFGITITNYCIFLIGLIYLIFHSDLPFKKKFNIFLQINTLCLMFITFFSYLQYFIWDTPLYFSQFIYSALAPDTQYAFKETIHIRNSLSFSTVMIYIYQVVFLPYIANHVYLASKITYEAYEAEEIALSVLSYDWRLQIVFVCFIILGIVLLLYGLVKKKFPRIFFLFVTILGYNLIFHFFYGTSEAFLYSQHFVFTSFVIFGLLLEILPAQWKKYYIPILIFALIVEITCNLYEFIQIINISNNYFNVTVMSFRSKIIRIVWLIILLVIMYAIKRLILKQTNYSFCWYRVFAWFMAISIVLALKDGIVYSFSDTQIEVSLDSYSTDQQERLSVQHDIEYYHNISSANTFSPKYQEILNSYKRYVNQYQAFIDNTKATLVKVNQTSDYYFFGFGKRKKLVYKAGKLIDVQSSSVLNEWNVSEEYIIPNEYTVLIRTEENDIIHLYEDSKGIHIERNETETMIDGTNIPIILSNFNNYEYSELLKVLYGEILFNIKNNVIYPNIFVYEQPWYRDGAITSMVLEHTNNINLITDWLNDITEIYDKQNAGNKEPDNLGEVIYLLSHLKNPNNPIIQKAINEAQTIARSNSEGYYLHGLTDFSSKSKYQTCWYNMSLKKLNLTQHSLDIPKNSDDYCCTMWWNNNENEEYPSLTPSAKFPYLAWGQFHCIGKGTVYLNNALYPLSWESDASQADYQKMTVVDDYFVNAKTSPTHTWCASELFMYIISKNRL